MRLTRPLCLASASPRRREFLERYGLPFVPFSPRVDESVLEGESPGAHVSRLAEAKAQAAAVLYPDHVVLAGDTVVVHGDAILGKPVDEEDARRMLTLLAGSEHRVLSAYLLWDARAGENRAKVVETRVVFRELPPQWIQWYSRQDESRDKAGAYGIQGLGGAMVERIEGSYPNVVGMPIEHILWDMIDKGWIAL